MKHESPVTRANQLWWQTFAEACAECIKNRPDMSDTEIDRYAVSKADQAREKFLAEKQDFTHA